MGRGSEDTLGDDTAMASRTNAAADDEREEDAWHHQKPLRQPAWPIPGGGGQRGDDANAPRMANREATTEVSTMLPFRHARRDGSSGHGSGESGVSPPVSASASAIEGVTFPSAGQIYGAYAASEGDDQSVRPWERKRGEEWGGSSGGGGIGNGRHTSSQQSEDKPITASDFDNPGLSTFPPPHSSSSFPYARATASPTIAATSSVPRDFVDNEHSHLPALSLPVLSATPWQRSSLSWPHSASDPKVPSAGLGLDSDHHPAGFGVVGGQFGLAGGRSGVGGEHHGYGVEGAGRIPY